MRVYDSLPMVSDRFRSVGGYPQAKREKALHVALVRRGGWDRGLAESERVTACLCSARFPSTKNFRCD